MYIRVLLSVKAKKRRSRNECDKFRVVLQGVSAVGRGESSWSKDVKVKKAVEGRVFMLTVRGVFYCRLVISQ
jgi:hypothetical protein